MSFFGFLELLIIGAILAVVVGLPLIALAVLFLVVRRSAPSAGGDEQAGGHKTQQ